MSTFSADVAKKVELLNTYSVCNVNALQTGLIPHFVDIQWKKSNSYFQDGYKVPVRDGNKLALSIKGIKYKKQSSKRSDNVCVISMIAAIAANLIDPFILFINGAIVKWTDITIARHYNSTSLIINNHLNTLLCTSVDLLNIPFNVNYSENNVLDESYTEIFRFDNDGKISAIGENIISVKNTNIVYYTGTIATDSLSNKELPINNIYKISSNNIILFKDGLLYKNYTPSIKNLNILDITCLESLKDSVYKIFYNKYGTRNVSNATIPENPNYVKLLFEDVIESQRINTDNLNTDFNLTFNKSINYTGNITNGINTIFSYNPSLVKDLYSSRCKVFSKTYTGSYIISKMDQDGYVTLPRDKYNGEDTYVIIFVNGILNRGYDTITYLCNSFKVLFETITDGDVVEIVYFRGVNNSIVETSFTLNDRTVENRVIPHEDLLIFCQYTSKTLLYPVVPNENTLYSVDFTIEDNVLTFTDSSYYGKNVVLASNKQFMYYFQPSNIENRYTLTLTSDFKTCLDASRYLVFINGRLCNPDTYSILLPNINNPFIEPTIYFGIYLSATDIIEVFYLPVESNYVNMGFTVITDTYNVPAEVDNQSTFKIPYPYNSYIQEKNSFMVIVGSVLVDPDRYEIVGDSIVFSSASDYIKIGVNVTFIFIYNLLEGTGFVDVSEEDFIKFNTKTVVATADNQSTFAIPVGVPEHFILSVGSIFIDPQRYTVSGGNITFTDSADYITLGNSVDFIYAYDYQQNPIELQTQIATATINGQAIFDLPVSDITNNFIIIKNGVVVPSNKYNIIGDKMIFMDTNYYVDINCNIFFVFIDTPRDVNGDIIGDKMIKMTTKSVLITEENQVSFDIPPLSQGYKYTKNSFILSIGSVFIDPSRYEIVDNKIIFGSADGLTPGRLLSFIFSYSSRFGESITGDSAKNDYIKIETVSIEATIDGQLAFEMPNTEDGIISEYFVSKGSVFIDPQRYHFDFESNSIIFDYPEDAVPLGDDILITFVYASDCFLSLQRKHINITATQDYQTIFDIPIPFHNYLELTDKFLVFVGSTYVDRERYYVDKKLRQLVITDHTTIIEQGCDLTFVFFYMGDGVHSIRLLPENGYIYVNKYNLKYNLYKKLYMLFVNGKKINENDIMDISGNIIRIKKDPRSLYNITMVNFTPSIKEFEQYLRVSSMWDNIINETNYIDLNNLMNIYTYMTDVETRIEQTISHETIINDIGRDYWGAYVNQNGDPFTYNYDESILMSRDSGDNYIVELQNGSTYNSNKNPDD